MPDTADTTDTIRILMVLNARVDSLERTLAEIKTALRQPMNAVARTSADGTVAIRDPNIVAQRQRTGTFGYAPYEDPG
jgi:hypothetical protein